MQYKPIVETYIVLQDLTPISALFALLGRTSGRFVYTSGIPEEAGKLPVLGGFMGLIMEGMRRIDEEEVGS